MPLVLNGATSGSTTIQATDAVTATLTLPSATGTLISTASSGQVIPSGALPAGTALQVVSTAKTDTYQIASSSFTDISGLSVSITPKFSTSKILVTVCVNACASSTNYGIAFRLTRAGTAICLGNASGSRLQSSFMGVTNGGGDHIQVYSMTFLDSPATTSSTAYQLQLCSENSSTTVVNAPPSDSDSNSPKYARPPSTITVMEIAA